METTFKSDAAPNSNELCSNIWHWISNKNEKKVEKEIKTDL